MLLHPICCKANYYFHGFFFFLIIHRLWGCFLSKKKKREKKQTVVTAYCLVLTGTFTVVGVNFLENKIRCPGLVVDNDIMCTEILD